MTSLVSVTSVSADLVKQAGSVDSDPLRDETESELRAELFAGLAIIAVSPDITAAARGDARELQGALGRLTDRLSATSVGAFREAALATNRLFPELVFDDSAPQVALAHRIARDRMRIELGDGLAEFLRAANEIAAQRGLQERELIRLLRTSMGLNGQGLRAVERFRQQLLVGSAEALQRRLGETLEDAVRRALASDVRTARQIDTLVERYTRQLVAVRVRMVSRLQAQRVVGEGTDEFLRQVFDTTAIGANEVEEVWQINPPRVRASHQFMAGQVRPVGVAFTSGDGNLLRFPGDPSAPLSDTINCKCSRTVRRVDT